MYKDMDGVIRYTGLTRMHKDVQGYKRIYKHKQDIQRCPRQSAHGMNIRGGVWGGRAAAPPANDTRAHKGTQGYTKIYEDTQAYARIVKDIRRHAKIYEDRQG